jgi:anti-sigma-K factor RskA
MQDPGELEALAGEYVLGVLPEEERVVVERRLAGDRALAARVAAWERRLLPLARWLPPVAPPPQVWWAINRSLSLPRAARSSWRGGLAFWRAWAAVASLAAVGLAAFLYTGLPDPESRLVAVLLDAQADPAPIIRRSRDRQLQVRSLAGPPAGRTWELWVIPLRSGPVSLGLIGSDGTIRSLTENEAALLEPHGALAVSVEPEGGSPTGAPTGPLVLQGVLLPTE